MPGVDVGGGIDDRARRRRGLVTLVVWYVVAAVAPVALGTALLGTEFLEPAEESTDPTCGHRPLECGPLFPDAWTVSQVVVPFLLVSLVVALPLRYAFDRQRWHPVLAGSVAPVCAWLVCLVASCGVLLLRSR